MIGVVDKVGEGVRHLAIGDKVAELTILGSYSEYMVLPAKQLGEWLVRGYEPQPVLDLVKILMSD